MGKNLNKIVNATLATGSVGLAYYGEKLQSLASQHLIDYNFCIGHLSDFAAICAFSSAFNFLGNFSSENKTSYLASLFMGFVWSGMELSGKFGKPDPYDILAYFTGASLAILTDYTLTKFKTS